MNAEMRTDLKWFQEFAAAWNGVSFMVDMVPIRDIVADACLTGIGAASDKLAYSFDVARSDDPISNISEIEAVNVAAGRPHLF